MEEIKFTNCISNNNKNNSSLQSVLFSNLLLATLMSIHSGCLQLWQQCGSISNFLDKILNTHHSRNQENCGPQKPMQQTEDNQGYSWKSPSFLCDMEQDQATTTLVISWNYKEQFYEEITGEISAVKSTSCSLEIGQTQELVQYSLA